MIDGACGIPETVPVFPLPDVVFFPQTVLPLHIFEPRYREMVERASGAEGCVVMTLLRPGWESEYEGNPAYHEVGCVGRIRDLRRTEDGRFYLKLIGLRKVALGELVGDRPYRTARIRLIRESVPPEPSPGNREDLLRLLGACTALVQELSEKPFPMVTVKEGLPYEAVVNSVCLHVGLAPPIKQSLLEVDDVRERCLRLTDLMETHLQKVLLSRGHRKESDRTELVN
jgi:Lon protease-like protein